MTDQLIEYLGFTKFRFSAIIFIIFVILIMNIIAPVKK
jgi:hypothetical protein